MAPVVQIALLILAEPVIAFIAGGGKCRGNMVGPLTRNDGGVHRPSPEVDEDRSVGRHHRDVIGISGDGHRQPV